MRYEVFSDHTTSQEHGIIVPNHLASSIDDTLGDRAEYLNQSTGLTVVAFERPGTASLKRCPSFSVESYIEDVSERALRLQGILKALGIDRAIITHDSAGAVDSLALAASGQIKVERVIPVEPVSMKKVASSARELGIWAKAALRGNKGFNLEEFKDLKELEVKRERPSDIELKMRGWKEFKAYKKIFSSDIARTLLKRLAEDGVPVDLVFAEHSFATPAELQNEVRNEFVGKSVTITVLPGAEHACVEPYAHFVHIVNKILQTRPIESE